MLTCEERGDVAASERKWKLWNPLRGQSFSVTNANGPMRSIWGIANSQNVSGFQIPVTDWTYAHANGQQASLR